MARAKGEDEPPLFPSADGTQVEEQLRAVTTALCGYAADALSGDFSAYGRVPAILRENLAQRNETEDELVRRLVNPGDG
jgi:hypothetical protein